MDKQDDREAAQSGNGELSEDDIYWLAVEIVQDRYKDIQTPMIAAIAEKVTEERIPSSVDVRAIGQVLSNRITAEVRRTRKKASKPVGHHAPRKTEPKFLGSRRSGSLTIMKFAGRDSQGHNIWLALCDCQKHNPSARLTPVREDNLRSGRATSCGCHRMRLMRGNQRARKQSRRSRAAQTLQQQENTPLAPNTAEKNLILRGPSVSAPPACQHGFKFIKLDFVRGDGKARYCELCGLMNDMPAAGSTNWAKRLEHENLAMTRGMAPSIDSPTSPKARKFSKTADRAWAGGKNIVLVGGSAELGIVDGVRQTRDMQGGLRRSAAGRDKVKPWQNPNVDFDESADAADSSRRVAKKPENLLDEQTFGLDDCYGDRDEIALLKYELGEKAIDEDSAKAIADDDGEDLKGDKQ